MFDEKHFEVGWSYETLQTKRKINMDYETDFVPWNFDLVVEQ